MHCSRLHSNALASVQVFVAPFTLDDSILKGLMAPGQLYLPPIPETVNQPRACARVQVAKLKVFMMPKAPSIGMVLDSWYARLCE